ncbi:MULTISPECIES: hypothetical protein [unclassified Halomonas]|uniref:hypothetical protein n=1 Tax=unclassified Halomonas TaxID=2609666 RepID=UPI001CF444D2|nr:MULTISPECIES: hypothetical protein [unclassified Halomonas]MCA8865302.1 hypothetical protein [Halomonas sp. SBBP1]UZH12265.1 hypothetical protein OM794_11250 [Halomonas sp. BDJS001]
MDDFELGDNEQAIEELIELGYLDHGSKEYGITRQFVNDGYDSLSTKQKHIFNQSTGLLMKNAKCLVCDNSIPFSELPVFLEEGDQLCSYHRNSSFKND